MLFHSSLRKELARSFGATLVVLVTIVMTMTLIRTLSQATRGSVNPSEVMMVMGYTVLGHLPTILTLSLFVSVVGTMSRLYRDSEMAVWLTAGLSPRAWIRPVLSFAVPLTVLIALVSLFLAPWAKGKGNEYAHLLKQREEVSALAPGIFKEAQGGKRVYFIERYSAEDGAAKHLFVQQVEASGKLSTIFAQEGRVQTDDRTGERTGEQPGAELRRHRPRRRRRQLVGDQLDHQQDGQHG